MIPAQLLHIEGGIDHGLCGLHSRDVQKQLPQLEVDLVKGLEPNDDNSTYYVNAQTCGFNVFQGCDGAVDSIVQLNRSQGGQDGPRTRSLALSMCKSNP